METGDTRKLWFSTSTCWIVYRPIGLDWFHSESSRLWPLTTIWHITILGQRSEAQSGHVKRWQQTRSCRQRQRCHCLNRPVQHHKSTQLADSYLVDEKERPTNQPPPLDGLVWVMWWQYCASSHPQHWTLQYFLSFFFLIEIIGKMQQRWNYQWQVGKMFETKSANWIKYCVDISRTQIQSIHRRTDWTMNVWREEGHR